MQGEFPDFHIVYMHDAITAKFCKKGVTKKADTLSKKSLSSQYSKETLQEVIIMAKCGTSSNSRKYRCYKSEVQGEKKTKERNYMHLNASVCIYIYNSIICVHI